MASCCIRVNIANTLPLTQLYNTYPEIFCYELCNS
jgi:hypothetical protein